MTGTDNYGAAENTAKITIKNAAFSVTATGYDGTYDAEAHSITVTADGAAITYSETENGTYSETNPVYTDAGEYTVYYKATKANYDDVTGSAVVKISKADQTLSFAETAVTKYVNSDPFTVTLTNTGDGAVTYASSDESVATVDSTGKVTIKGAGTATITASAAATDNYNEATASYTLTVKELAKSYVITAGANQSVVKNYNGTITITCNGEYSKFIGLQIDGATVATSNYSVQEGSTIVTLAKAYVSTLSVGTHTVRFVYNDGGYAETNLTITQSRYVAPRLGILTGDDANLGLWAALLALSALGVAGAVTLTRRRKYSGKHGEK